MHDDLLLRVERMAPGFGGMFIDPNGRLAVYLLDPSQLSAARSAIEAVFVPGLTAHGGVMARSSSKLRDDPHRYAARAPLNA